MLVDVFLSVAVTSASASAVIILCLVLSRAMTRRCEARWSVYIWLVLVVRLLLPFGLNIPGFTSVFVVPAYTAEESPAAVDAYEHADFTGTAAAEYSVHDNDEAASGDKNRTSVDFIETAAYVWLCGCVLFLSIDIVVFVHYRTKLLRRGHDPQTDGVRAAIAQLTNEMGVTGRLRAVVSPDAASPMLTGIFRPILILPREDYPPAELRLIIRHELTHMSHRDIPLKAAVTAANAVHWFNPLVYLMSHETDRCIELRCDSDVIKEASKTVRADYGRAILAAAGADRRAVPASTAFGGGTGEMKERIENIFDTRPRKTTAAPFVIAVIAIVLSCAVIAVTAGKRTSAPQEVQTDEVVPAMQNILPPISAECPLISTDGIENAAWSDGSEAYLDLHGAILCINYARCTEYSADVPADDRSEYFYDYVGFERTTCPFFGSGIPCAEWQSNKAWLYPFHSDGSDPFSSGETRAAWEIIVTDPRSEAAAGEMIYVDAQTGDMYIPTARGGYRPSPYSDRSEYAKALISE